MEKETYTQWHPAFCSALKLELREDAEHLTYTNEYNINTKPLQMDMLIIKKTKDIEIKNQLGKLFLGHNIVEYKSQDDSMNVDVFLKTKGYAYIYKANEKHVDDILLEDITITLIRRTKPVKLIKWLQTQEYHIVEKYKGIFYVLKKYEIPVQIVISKDLSSENQKWLTLLKQGLTEEDARRAVCQTNDLEEKEEVEYADSIMQVIMKANKSVFERVKEDDEDMCEALRELMAKEIEEALEKAIHDGTQQGLQQGLHQGLRQGKFMELIQLVKKNIISVEVAASEMELSVEDFKKKVEEYETSLNKE